MKTAALFVLALAASTAQAQYRCTSPTGTVSFQQAPCPTGERQAALDIKTTPAEPDGRQFVRDAMARGRLVNGMTRDELRRAMVGAGTPEISRSWSNGQQREHWTWRQEHRTLHVPLTDGVVDYMHEAPTNPPRSP